MRDTILVRQRPTLLRFPEPDLRKLKLLSARTRISQSAYLREALDDLLQKYAEVFTRTAEAQK